MRIYIMDWLVLSCFYSWCFSSASVSVANATDCVLRQCETGEKGTQNRFRSVAELSLGSDRFTELGTVDVVLLWFLLLLQISNIIHILLDNFFNLLGQSIERISFSRDFWFLLSVKLIWKVWGCEIHLFGEL